MHIDVQGAELEVLKGGQQILKYIDFIWIEVSKVELYENQPLVDEIQEFFNLNDFVCVLSLLKVKNVCVII